MRVFGGHDIAGLSLRKLERHWWWFVSGATLSLSCYDSPTVHSSVQIRQGGPTACRTMGISACGLSLVDPGLTPGSCLTLGMQPRFGNRPLTIWLVSPQKGTAVLLIEGLTISCNRLKTFSYMTVCRRLIPCLFHKNFRFPKQNTFVEPYLAKLNLCWIHTWRADDVHSAEKLRSTHRPMIYSFMRNVEHSRPTYDTNPACRAECHIIRLRSQLSWCRVECICY